MNYLPFGDSQLATEGVINPLRYAGREMDGATGLYYNRNRWYDPMLHRFISEDPIGLGGGINLYAYVGNDPVNHRDPSGLVACALYITSFTLLGETTPIAMLSDGCGETGHSNGIYGLTGPIGLPGANGMQEPRAANPSSCLSRDCRLRNPEPAEIAFVNAAISAIRNDHPFCVEIQTAGRAMVNRNLLMWNNPIIGDVGLTRGRRRQMFGNAPFDSRFGGVVMYLYAPTLTAQDVVHEAVHGVINPALRIQPTYYADPGESGSYRTPLGNIDEAASYCLGR